MEIKKNEKERKTAEIFFRFENFQYLCDLSKDRKNSFEFQFGIFPLLLTVQRGR